MLIPAGAARLSRLQLAVLGGSVYVATVLAVYLWHPTSSGLVLAKLILTGVERDRAVTQMTPLLLHELVSPPRKVPSGPG